MNLQDGARVKTGSLLLNDQNCVSTFPLLQILSLISVSVNNYKYESEMCNIKGYYGWLNEIYIPWGEKFPIL